MDLQWIYKETADFYALKLKSTQLGAQEELAGQTVIVTNGM